MKKHLAIFLVTIIMFAQFAYAERCFIVEVETNIKGSLFNSWFTEPIEICYFIMNDGAIYKHTSHEENRVEISTAEMKRDGYEVADIALIIHNHFVNPHFSLLDEDAYRRFYRKGFRGAFLLWRYKIGWIKQLISVENLPQSD